MSFRDGKSFSVRYKSSKHLQRALNRNRSWDRSFSPQGQTAIELFDLIAIGASLTVTTTMAGAQIGTCVAGPKGTAIGAAIGFGVGAAATMFVIQWYVEVMPTDPKDPNGAVVAVYRPA